MGLHNRKHLDKIRDEIDFFTHQVDGVRDMCTMGSFILADDMGLGKSLQALTVAACDFQLGYARRILIVAPVTLKENWLEEIRLHTKFSAMVLQGAPTLRRLQLDEYAASGTDILICNYEQVKSHLETLNSFMFDIVIMDEAHYIKNHKAGRTTACQDLYAPRSFLITGSPILNQVDDLWSLLHRVDPDSFPNYWRFVNRYAVWGGYKGKQIVGIKHKEELNTRLAKYMIRRTKDQCLDLPEKFWIEVKVGLSPLQKKLYQQAVGELKIDMVDGADPMELDNAMTKMLRLKQICGTTATIEGYEDESDKLDVAVEKAVELIEQGEHLIVFTQFRAVQKAFADRLATKKARQDMGKKGRLLEKIPIYQLHGDVKPPDRVPTVTAWANDRPGVIVCMLQVAGVGLNMTAASNQFFLDKLYAPKLNQQAEDRSHRIGQKKVVNIYHFICKGTVEDRIEQILRAKNKTFNSIVEESDWKRAILEALQEEEDEDGKAA